MKYQWYLLTETLEDGDAAKNFDDDGRAKRTGTLLTTSAHIITAVIGSNSLRHCDTKFMENDVEGDSDRVSNEVEADGGKVFVGFTMGNCTNSLGIMMNQCNVLANVCS